MSKGILPPDVLADRMKKNLTEAVQILEKYEGCLDRVFGRVYPVCLADDKFHLNCAFTLDGPAAMAAIPQPPRRDRNPSETVTLGGLQTFQLEPNPELEEDDDDKPEVTFGLGHQIVVPKGRPSPPATTSGPQPVNNFAIACTQMHEEYRKRSSPDSEDPPRETRRRKSTESGDSTDNEILVNTAILDLGSPETKATPQSRYEEYFTVEGRKLMADKNVTVKTGTVEYLRTGAQPKTSVYERLGLAVSDEQQITEEALEAERRAARELQLRVKKMEDDRREQERQQWEDEKWAREEQKAKREAERAKKAAAFRDTTEYDDAKDNMTRRLILQGPLPKGFTKVHPKEPEPEPVGKKGHRSDGRSSGQFGKQAEKPEKVMLVGFFDLCDFRYSKLYTDRNSVIAWAEMSINLEHLNRQVASISFFKKASEKTCEILGLVKYALICGIDGFRNTIVHWLSWVTDKSRPTPEYAPTPIPPAKTAMPTDVQVKANLDWRYHLSWLQHWHDAFDIQRGVFYGGAQQSDSQLVVIIVFLMNHVLDNPLKIEEIRQNMGWQLCRPNLNPDTAGAENLKEAEDAVKDQCARIGRRRKLLTDMKRLKNTNNIVNACQSRGAETTPVPGMTPGLELKFRLRRYHL